MLAIITMQMMPMMSCTQGLASGDAAAGDDIAWFDVAFI
jgi:hypothetical protein